MKKSFKGALVGLMTCVAMLTSASLPVSACYKSGCAATTTTVNCGSYIITTYSQHLLHTNVYCSKTGNVSDHTKTCGGCGTVLENLGGRVCSWKHKYCPDERYVCQY